MALHVGTAPVSWGVWFPDDPRQPPWNRFLDEAVLAGYEAIELGPHGYLPTDRAILRAELNKRGLQLTGAFLIGAFQENEAWTMVKPHASQICDILNDLGARYLVLINDFHTDIFSGESIGRTALAGDEWSRMINTVHLIGDYTRSRGIRSMVHPHAETWVEYEDQVERLLADTDSEMVSLCLDVGHYAYRKGDAVALLQRHHERIPYLHLKNVNAEVLNKVEEERLSFAEGVQLGIFADLDKGMVDFVAIRNVLDAAGFEGWGIVEQDMYPVEFDKPLPIAKHNREYLQRIGLG